MKSTEHHNPPTSCAACKLWPLAIYGRHLDGDGGDGGDVRRLRANVLAVGPRRIVLREGEVPSTVYTLYEGWAVRFKILPDGRRQILGFLLPGDMIVFQALRREPLRFAVQTLTDAQLCAFPAEGMRDLILSDSEREQRLRDRCFRESVMLDSRLTDLGRRSATERLARLILELRARLERRGLADGNRMPFPLRQRDIADTLGLTPVHVSRVMTALRSQGVIDAARNTVTIANRGRLEEIAGEL